MKAKVYCNKQDCSKRKTFIGDTGEYSRNLCCNTTCGLVTDDPPQSEATISGWVCRDKDGTLCLYYNKPMRGKEEWFGNYDRQLPEESFPSLTWQDEPIEVEITIKPKKQ